jgi:DNA-binding MarR family transcriptional regulator
MYGLLMKLEETTYAARGGVSYQQFLILITIESCDPPVTQTTIARRLLRQLNTISMIVDRMVRLGLVTKTRSEVDRREAHVAMTALGKEKLARAIRVGGALRERLGSTFSEEELQTCMRLITRLRTEVLKELGREPVPAKDERDARQRVIEVFKRGRAAGG